jgi:hypothetical protein
MLRTTLYETDEATCRVCRGSEVDVSEEPDVKIAGVEPDLTQEEYMILFNRSVREGEELTYHLPAVKDLTPEELVDHVNLLTKFSTRIRIAKQAVKVTLEAKRIHLTKEHKDALKVRDMQYKPKPAPTEEKTSKPRRAAGTAKSLDAIDTIMKLMGCTREQAERRLAKAAAKLEAQEEQS